MEVFLILHRWPLCLAGWGGEFLPPVNFFDTKIRESVMTLYVSCSMNTCCSLVRAVHLDCALSEAIRPATLPLNTPSLTPPYPATQRSSGDLTYSLVGPFAVHHLHFAEHYRRP